MKVNSILSGYFVFIIGILFFLTLFNEAHASNHKIDSLKAEIHTFSSLSLSDSTMGSIHYEFAMEYFHVDSLEQALTQAQKALKFTPSNTNLAFQINNSMGDFHLKRNDYVKSLQSFKKALEIATYLEDNSKIGVVHYNLHVHYDKTNQPKLALQHLNDSYDLIKETQDTLKTINLLNSLAGYNLEERNLGLSQSQFEEALQLALEQDDSSTVSICYTNYADYFLISGDTIQAIKMLNRAYRIDSEIGSIEDRIISAYNIATIFRLQNKLDSAESFYLESYEHSIESEALSYQKIINSTLFRLYYQMEKIDSLPVIFSHYKQITDSIFSKNELKKYADTQNEIALIEKESELKIVEVVQKENRQKLLMLSMFAAILGIVLIGLFIARNDLDKRQQELQELYTQTENQKNEIENQKNQLEVTNKTLEQNAIGKDRIMSLLAHDLRTPLSSVNSLNQLIETSGEINEKQIEYLQTSNKIIHGGLDLISDILDIYKLENLDDFELETINISALLNNSIEKVKPNALVKNQTIITDFESNIEFKTNREMLQSAVDNILSNAVKYSSTEKKIFVAANHTENNLTISIKDEGLGFSPKEKEVLFDRFNKFTRSTIQSESSTGLGLFLVKGFVEKLNGTITVDTLKDKGTTFTLVFQSP